MEWEDEVHVSIFILCPFFWCHCFSFGCAERSTVKPVFVILWNKCYFSICHFCATCFRELCDSCSRSFAVKQSALNRWRVHYNSVVPVAGCRWRNLWNSPVSVFIVWNRRFANDNLLCVRFCSAWQRDDSRDVFTSGDEQGRWQKILFLEGGRLPSPLPLLHLSPSPFPVSISPSLFLPFLSSRSPYNPAKGFGGSAVSSPSGVRGGAPVGIEFGAF